MKNAYALGAALALLAPAFAAAQTTKTTQTTETTTQVPASTPTVIYAAPPAPSTPTVIYAAPPPPQTTTVTTTETKENIGWQRGGLEIGGRATYDKPRGGADSWSPGLQLRIHMSKNWALEGSGDYRRTTVSGPAAGTSGSTRVDVFPVQGSLIGYIFPDSPVTPYVLAGAGWYFTHPEGGHTSNRFGPHVGGGLQFFLNHYWSIDGSYRYIWLSGFHTGDSSLSENIFRDGGHMVTIGLNYHF